MLHARGKLLLLTAVLALASCSQGTPTQPLTPTPTPAPTGGTPTDSSLAANRARWMGAGLRSYRYRFQWICFCTTEYVRLVDITVSQGAIVSVVDATTGMRLSTQEAAQYRTIDGLFDFVRTSMDQNPARIDVAFDARLGFPSMAYVDYVAGMADEELGFRIYELTPLRGPFPRGPIFP